MTTGSGLSPLGLRHDAVKTALPLLAVPRRTEQETMVSPLHCLAENIFLSNASSASVNPPVKASEAINLSFESASDRCKTANVSQIHDSNLTGPHPILEHTLTEIAESNSDATDPQASIDDTERAMSVFHPRSLAQTIMTTGKPDTLDNVAPQIILAFISQKAPYLTLDGIYKFVEKWAETDNLKGDINQLLHSYDFTTQPFQLQNGGIAFKLPLGIETPIDAPSFPDKPFRLMDLPLRIRLKIYNFVLGMPTTHGWIIDQDYTANAPQLYNRALQNPSLSPLRLRTLAVPRWSLFSRPLQEVLSLISTSKGIYNEAMPVFYGTNTFSFDSCTTLRGFLSGLPTRRPFIKNVILTYDPSLYDRSCDKAFQLLAQTNLKRLCVKLNEAHVLNLGGGWGNVARMPGFYTLERIRGLDELSFSGNFQRSKKFLRRMVEPRVGTEPELEEVLEEEHAAVLARRRLDLKEEVKRLKRAAKGAAREQKKAVKQAEKEEERERRKAERAAERARRDELLEAERRRHKTEVMQRRAKKELERKREREAKEEIRTNKQRALLEKARLTAQAKGLMKRQQEEDEEEEEAKVGSSRKRGKVAANDSRRSAAKLPVQKPIKTVSGSNRKVAKVPFAEQSSSDDESVGNSRTGDEMEDMNIDPQLLEIDRQTAQRQAREESTESEAD